MGALAKIWAGLKVALTVVRIVRPDVLPTKGPTVEKLPPTKLRRVK